MQDWQRTGQVAVKMNTEYDDAKYTLFLKIVIYSFNIFMCFILFFAALQLRYLQTLNTISAEKNSTIIFPIPIDIIAPFLAGGMQK